jgi:hypothetical protein
VLDLPAGGIMLELPFAVPSQNVYMRWHWARRRRLRDEARLLIRFQINRIQLPPRPEPCRAVVEVHRYGRRQLDYGNLVGGGAKACLDALVLEGVIHDDRPEWLDEIYRQDKATVGERTLLRVRPAAPGGAPTW